MIESMHKRNDERLRIRTRNVVIMLTCQFLLGMAVNLVGGPSETTGTTKVESTILLGAHVLLAFGIVVGAFGVAMSARRLGKDLNRLAHGTGLVVLLTFAAGVVAMGTKGWLGSAASYAMAVGFIATLLLYGVLYNRTYRRQLQTVALEAQKSAEKTR